VDEFEDLECIGTGGFDEVIRTFVVTLALLAKSAPRRQRRGKTPPTVHFGRGSLQAAFSKKEN